MCMYVYTYVCNNDNESKRDHEFEREHGVRVHRKCQEEERVSEKDVIII